MYQLRKEGKGITLIALVVTIVVLLILAGVSISMLTGENGIITQAQRAKESTKKAEKEEEERLREMERELLDKGQIPVEKVTDENPGELSGEGTKEKPYLIESIEDLIQFSEEVNLGNSFEDKYIKVTRNLDFNSDDSYVNPDGTELFGDYNNDGRITGIKEEATDKEQKGFKAIGKELIAKDTEDSDKYVGNFFRRKI